MGLSDDITARYQEKLLQEKLLLSGRTRTEKFIPLGIFASGHTRRDLYAASYRRFIGTEHIAMPHVESMFPLRITDNVNQCHTLQRDN